MLPSYMENTGQQSEAIGAHERGGKAVWISTNITNLHVIAVIQNLASIGTMLEMFPERIIPLRHGQNKREDGGGVNELPLSVNSTPSR